MTTIFLSHLRRPVSGILIFRKTRQPRLFIKGVLVLALLLACGPHAFSQKAPPAGVNNTAAIPAAEFSRMVQEFSEGGGYFHSDNFTSNETSYLHIVGKLKELGVSGGAYIGVGPEQNFTYIAKIRPRIAFIVDIRRQAIIQHLLYKTIFHLAENRAQFLSLLFSKAPPKSGVAEGSLEDILDRISAAPTTEDAYNANLATIRKTIEENFHFPLSQEDLKSLNYIYTAFWRANLRIGFSFGNGGYGNSWGFPSLADLILATDLNGNRGNFLAQEDDYQFVRKLQEQNRVIPVVGDFAGTHALSSIAGYLRKNNYTVSAFYTSNVEEFLYQNDVFGKYAENIRQLPVSDTSVFIRAARSGGYRHPARQPGDRMTPLLEKIAVFLDDYKNGLIPDYWSLVTTHYIAASEPRREAPPLSVP